MDLQQAKDLFKQANLAYKNNDLEKSIDLFSQIEKTSDELKEIYAKTQFNLGLLLAQQQNFKKAEQAYNNVSRSDSAEQYAKAQVNLGALLKQTQRFKEAEQAYKNVIREDSLKQYAMAQVNLGLLLAQQKNFKEAEQAYKNVKREDSGEQYAKAQFNLGNLLREQPDCKNKAEECYKNVSSEDSKQAYAYAQWNLYWIFGKNKNYLINIQKEHDEETYAKARFILGSLEENLDSKNHYWRQIPEDSEQYKKESYQINVVKNIAELKESQYKNELFEVFEGVSEVLETLFVNNQYEQSIAHYTNLSVSKLLLSNKNEKLEDFEPKSKLRLNTINLMNDPEEGLLINKLLCLSSKIITQDSAFIACFTLHHDSLNQFRLYGKEDKEEASGLSLVLNKNFFATEHNAARIYQKEASTSERTENDKEKINSLAAMPLYRCIYFDPTSGLIKVAQREEWSFKREFKLEGEHDWYAFNEQAENNWQQYLEGSDSEVGIIEIEKNVRSSLESLSKLVKSLEPEKLNDKEQEILAEILLPLRYLMKHMAFKEEQECRIVYVTQMDNSLIQYHEKINRIYIDYEPSVMEHLEKIYLAPKAKGEKMVFEYLCSRGQTVRKGKTPVKVKISQNPFQ